MLPLFMEPGELKKKKKRRNLHKSDYYFHYSAPFFPTLAMVAIAPFFKHAQ